MRLGILLLESGGWVAILHHRKAVTGRLQLLSARGRRKGRSKLARIYQNKAPYAQENREYEKLTPSGHACQHSPEQTDT